MEQQDPFRAKIMQATEALVQEHNREITAVYEDNLRMRQELARVGEMMQAYLEREKNLHEMLGSLTDMHTKMGHDLHEKTSNAVAQHQGHKSAKDQLTANPTNTANEIHRIQHILASPPAPPPCLSSSMPYSVAPQTRQLLPQPVHAEAGRFESMSPFRSQLPVDRNTSSAYSSPQQPIFSGFR